MSLLVIMEMMTLVKIVRLMLVVSATVTWVSED